MRSLITAPRGLGAGDERPNFETESLGDCAIGDKIEFRWLGGRWVSGFCRFGGDCAAHGL